MCIPIPDKQAGVQLGGVVCLNSHRLSWVRMQAVYFWKLGLSVSLLSISAN